MSPLSKRWLAAMLVLIGASCYGMLSPIIKLAYLDGWNENQISAGQMLWGAVFMWVIVLLRPKAWSNPFRGPWVQLSLIGIFGLACTTLLLNWALKLLDASFAIVLLFQFTWITLLLDSLIRKKRPKPVQLAAVFVILTGTFLTADFSLSSLKGAGLAGIGLALSGALTYSLFILLTGYVRTTMDPALRSAVMLTAALPIVLLLYPPQLMFAAQSGSLLAWGILAGLLGQFIPTVCFNIGTPVIGGPLAAVLGSIELPVAVIAASFLLREQVGWLQWFGVILIVAGIVVSEMKIGHMKKPLISNTQGETE